MTWLRSVLAIGAGFAVTTVVYVYFGKLAGDFILRGVEWDHGYNLTAAGNVRLATNIGVALIPFAALGGFVAALLAPARRWCHGLGVGVAVSAVFVLLWVDGVRRGQESEMSWASPLIMVGIIVGCALGGLVGQGLLALLIRGRARIGRRDEVPSD